MGKKKERKIDLDEGSSSYTHRPFAIKAYGLLSVAVLAVLFIGILEIIAHKFPRASTPFRPTPVPSATNIVNATNASPAVEKRQEQVRLAVLAPPNACGFSRQLTEACFATQCLDKPDATLDSCADYCTTLGIWPFEPKRLCPRQNLCGYTNTLSNDCRNYCYAHDAGNPFNATDTTCGNYCTSHEMQPFEPKPCNEGLGLTPGSPVGTPVGTPVGSPSAVNNNNNSPSPAAASPTPDGRTPINSASPELGPTPNGPTPEAPSSRVVPSSVVVVQSSVAASVRAISSERPVPSSVVVVVVSSRIAPSSVPLSPSPQPLSPSALPVSPSPLPVSPSARLLPSSPLAVSPSARPVPSSALPVSPSALPVSPSPVQLSPSARVAASSIAPLISSIAPLSASASIAPSISAAVASPSPLPPSSVAPVSAIVAVSISAAVPSASANSMLASSGAQSATAVISASVASDLFASVVSQLVSPVVSAANSPAASVVASQAVSAPISPVVSAAISPAASAVASQAVSAQISPAASGLASQVVSEAASPVASVVGAPSAPAASAILPAVSAQPAASQASVLPVVPIALPSNAANDLLQNEKTPAQPADIPVNPANAPITVAIVPQNPGSASTAIINTPSVVLPLLGVQTVASSVVFTNANGQVVTSPVTVFTPLADPLVPPPNALITKSSSIVVTNEIGKVSTVPVDVISPNKITAAPVIAAPERATPLSSPKDQQSPNPKNAGSAGGNGGSGGGSGGSSVGESGQGNLQKSGFTMSVSKTFSGGYLPIIVARAAHWGWAAIHSQLGAYEPFVQMNQPGGASGTVLLGSSFSSLWPSFVAYGAVVVLSPLAPELLVFDTSYCSNPNVNDPINPCYPAKVSTNIPIIRTLQSLLALIAFMAILAAYKAFKKPTGVSADPTCIVAVASVLHHPQVVRDFQGLSGEATDQDLKQFLETKKYKLGTYVTESGSERYGIIPVGAGDVNQALDLGWTPNGGQGATETTNNESKSSVLRMWKAISVYLDGIFLLFIVAVMCIAASYVRWVDRSVLARIFQFSNVGRRIVFTAIGMIVSSNWGRLLSDTQTVSPYLTLSRQDAPAKHSILIPKHNTALTSVLPALFRGQHTTFLVAFTALLAEFLVVALSGLPIRPGSTRDEFFFCGISALVILAVMVIVLVVVNLWRRALPHLPRKPDSTGGVMTYLAESRMLKDFEGIERMKTKERDQWIETLGNRYEYATKTSTATGQEKWVVDTTGKELADVENVLSHNPVVNASHMPANDARFGPGYATPLAPVQSSRSTIVSQFDHS